MASFSALIALLICPSVIHVIAEGNCTNEDPSTHKTKTATLLQMEASARQGSTVEGGRALLSRRAGKDDMSNDYTTEDFAIADGTYRQFHKTEKKTCCLPDGTYPTMYVAAVSKWVDCASGCMAKNRDHACYTDKWSTYGCFCHKNCDTHQDATYDLYEPTGVEFTQAQWEAWYTEFGFYTAQRTRPYAYSCNANNECNVVVLQSEGGGTNTFYSEGRRRRYKQYSVSGCQSSTAAAEGNAGRRRRYSESSYTDQEGCSTVTETLD